MRLVNKLIIMAMLIGIPLVVISVKFIGTTRQSLEFKIREVHRKTAENLGDRIEYFFSNYEKYCSTFIYNTDIENTERDYSSLLKPMMAQFNEFRIVSVSDGEGHLLMSLSSIDEVPPSELAKHVSLIPTALVLKEKRIHRSHAYRSGVDGSTLITIAFPLPEENRVLGVEIKLDELQSIVQNTSVGRTGFAYVVDASDHVVAHPDGEMLFKDLSAREMVSETSGGNISGVKNFLDENGVLMTGAYFSLPGGWRVIVQEPRADAYFTADRMKNLAVIAIMISLLLAVVAASYISMSLVGPMNKLVQGAGEISMGNLAHYVEVSGGGEMGFLARAFNSMSDSLSKRERAISGINQTAKRISTIVDRDTLAETAVDILVSVSGCSLVSVLPSTDINQHHTRLTDSSGSAANSSDVAMPKAFADSFRVVMESGSALVDTRFAWSDGAYKSVCFLPLVYEDEIMGALALADDDPARIFTSTDLHIYGIVASSMSISIKNIQLLEEAIEKTRLEEEIKTAELVQRTFFPESPPEIPGLDLSSFIQSASETGGDYFGFVHDPENSRVAVLIADVTGHGVPAAMVTATTFSFFQSLDIFSEYFTNKTFSANSNADSYTTGSDVLFDHMSPEFMLKCLNEIILRTTGRQLEMTVFASVFYYDTNRLVYSNAGHNQPMIYRREGFSQRGGKRKKQTLRYLVSSGRRLGEIENPSFDEFSIELDEGDTILWYTDGLTENENESGRQFGERRLEKLLQSIASDNVVDIQKRIISECKEFSAGTPVKDDITFIVGKVSGKQSEPAVQVSVTASAPVSTKVVRESLDRALIVSPDTSLNKKLEWFLAGFGASVTSFDDVEPAIQADKSNLQFCVLPIGGAMEQVLLASEVLKESPDAKIVFLSTVPFDSLFSLFMELKFPLQLVLNDSPNRNRIVRTIIAKHFSASSPGLRHHLGSAVPIHTIRIRDSFTRMKEAEQLFNFAESLGLNGYALDKLKFVVDELVMNAFYDAPTDSEGDYRYAEMSRTTPVKLPERETPVMEFASDGTYLGIGVRDPFGSLEEHEVMTRLEKHLFVENKMLKSEKAGAGLGLYQVYKSVDQLVFNVVPGQMSEIICLIKLSPSVKYIEKEIESIGFFKTGEDLDNGEYLT